MLQKHKQTHIDCLQNNYIYIFLCDSRWGHAPLPSMDQPPLLITLLVTILGYQTECINAKNALLMVYCFEPGLSNTFTKCFLLIKQYTQP